MMRAWSSISAIESIGCDSYSDKRLVANWNRGCVERIRTASAIDWDEIVASYGGWLALETARQERLDSDVSSRPAVVVAAAASALARREVRDIISMLGSVALL